MYSMMICTANKKEIRRSFEYMVKRQKKQRATAIKTLLEMGLSLSTKIPVILSINTRTIAGKY